MQMNHCCDALWAFPFDCEQFTNEIRVQTIETNNQQRESEIAKQGENLTFTRVRVWTFYESFGARQQHSVMWLILLQDLIAAFQNKILGVSVYGNSRAVAAATRLQ